MVLTSPLALSDLYDLLNIVSVTFDNPGNQEVTGLESGEILKADLAPQLWRGTITLVPMHHNAAEALKAKLSWLRGPGRAFFVSNPAMPGPADDPDGVILDTATPAILSLNADNKRLALDGLPAGYTLSAGDYISFAYDSDPTRYALHRLIEDAAADGNGETAQFEVEPHIREGAATSTAVTLIKPFCKAVIIPGTLDPGTSSTVLTHGIQFDFVQTLR